MNDLVSRKSLLSKYDAQHEGPPGKARDLIANEPAVDPKIEAVLLTIDEVRSLRLCWIEESGTEMHDRLYPAIYYGIGVRAGDKYLVLLTVPDKDSEELDDCERWLNIEDYNKFWRPWSSCPTDEQREATGWDD